MNYLPLAGRRILVTRAAQQAGKLSDGLKDLGAIPVEVPVLEIVPPVSYAALDRALGQIGEYDWVIFTSANTVEWLKARGHSMGITAPRESRAKVAAVGAATAEAARAAGWRGSAAPPTLLGEGVVRSFWDEPRRRKKNPFGGRGKAPRG